MYFLQSISFIIILLILIFIILCYAKKRKTKHPKIASHAVFIPKENILFLEEWIVYHMTIGVDIFFLYNNNGVNKKSGFDSSNKTLVPGKKNKHGIQYDKNILLSDKEIDDELTKLQKKYGNRIQFITWQPKDEHGNILYNQEEAFRDCLAKIRKKYPSIEWLLTLDMDEFLVIPSKHLRSYLNTIPQDVGNIVIAEKRFESRFLHLDKQIVDIDRHQKTKLDKWVGYKNLSRIANTDDLRIHFWYGKGKSIEPSDVMFCHYKMPSLPPDNVTHIKLIPQEVRQQIPSMPPQWKQKHYTAAPE